jgi:hypothetical protein
MSNFPNRTQASLFLINYITVLMLLNVSAASYSHLQGSTSAGDMFSVLYRLLNVNGKIFIHISVIP